MRCLPKWTQSCPDSEGFHINLFLLINQLTFPSLIVSPPSILSFQTLSPSFPPLPHPLLLLSLKKLQASQAYYPDMVYQVAKLGTPSPIRAGQGNQVGRKDPKADSRDIPCSLH